MIRRVAVVNEAVCQLRCMYSCLPVRRNGSEGLRNSQIMAEVDAICK